MKIVSTDGLPGEEFLLHDIAQLPISSTDGPSQSIGPHGTTRHVWIERDVEREEVAFILIGIDPEAFDLAYRPTPQVIQSGQSDREAGQRDRDLTDPQVSEVDPLGESQ
jgi:hypothetical protein